MTIYNYLNSWTLFILVLLSFLQNCPSASWKVKYFYVCVFVLQLQET